MPQIEIYTTRYCPYCHAAKVLLKRKGVAFNEIDVGGELRRFPSGELLVDSEPGG